MQCEARVLVVGLSTTAGVEWEDSYITSHNQPKKKPRGRARNTRRKHVPRASGELASSPEGCSLVAAQGHRAILFSLQQPLVPAIERRTAEARQVEPSGHESTCVADTVNPGLVRGMSLCIRGKREGGRERETESDR
jgi:hypothetical protein